MKRMLFLLVGSALWLGMSAGAAWADNGPHVAGALGQGPYNASTSGGQCATCHRAHTSQGAYNLVQSQPGLCYTCHGSGAGGASTDVLDGVGYVDANNAPNLSRTGNTWGGLISGGFQSAVIGTGQASKTLDANKKAVAGSQSIPVLATGQAVTSTHAIGSQGYSETAGYTAYGNGTTGVGSTITLTCASCHDPHGNGNYRILKSVPDVTSPDPLVKLTQPAAVTIPDTTSAKVYVVGAPGVGNYWFGSPGDAAGVPQGGTATTDTKSGTVPPDGFIQNIAAWCTTCHTRYLAGSGSYKTSTGDPIYTYRHRSDANYKYGGANCITCHVAHGSNASMGSASTIAFPGGNTLSADSRLLRADNRGVCVMCHTK